MERYFLEPYRFIPPYRSTFWCRLAGGLVKRHLRRKLGVVRWHFEGTELLQQSLNQKAGILLTPNHCRWADPLVLGALSIHMRQYLYYVASYHLFRQNKIMGWVLNRIGGYSIWREGADRESLRTTSEILASAERPVVLFPEGTWFRQNDRVGPLQDGLSLITRQAVRQANRPIVVHPVGVKYWFLDDPMSAILARLEALEQRIGWHPQRQLSLLERIEKLGTALLTLKEIEFLGSPQTGRLDDRIAHLIGTQVGRIELQFLKKNFPGLPLERIRRLRQQLSRQLLDKATDKAHQAELKRVLADLLCCENLNAHSLAYLSEHPSPERLAETILRIEETITDRLEVPIARMGAAVRIGPALDARASENERRGGESLVGRLRTAMQEQIDQLLRQGPPAEWKVTAPRLLPTHSPTTHAGQPAVTSASAVNQLIG